MGNAIQKRKITDLIRARVRTYIADPKLTYEEALVKETSFYWSAYNFLGTIILTILGFIMEAGTFLRYGFILITMFIITMILFGTRINFKRSFLPQLYAYILVTLVMAGWMGGPLDSGGLVLLGVFCVFMSAPFRDMKSSVAIALFYLAGLIILVILDPYLNVHPSMTPVINRTFFAMNLTWMATAQLVFIVYYFNTWGQYEIREKERLKELDETKNRLFTNITHEFRTPITLILGMADRVRHQDEETRSSMDTIRKNGKRLLRLVNQMLNLAKLESGKMELQPVRSDIVRFVEFIVHTFQPFAESKQIRLHFASSTESILMDFDPEKLEEAVSNLLTNALRFTRKGGKVDVEVKLEETEDVEYPEHLLIRVSDNGKGIPEEKLEHIFDRFYQVEESEAHHQEGSGVGLTLVRENVNLMGGQVDVKSKEGIGTTFWIKLPVTCEAPLKTDLELSLDEAYVGISQDKEQEEEKEKVHDEALPLLLIIEDHMDMITYIKSLLPGEYRVLSALNGALGLEKAREVIPDIIISDVMMPKMDGFEMLGKLKADIRTSHIPVILLTARADMQSKLEGLELGAEAYLPKPFDKRELRIRLRKMLEQRRILQNRYLSQNLLQKPAETRFAMEDGFMDKIHGIIDAHLDEEGFSVDTCSREVGMSRTQLYRKMKALTDLPVDRYIRKYRLHRAMEFLKTKDLNVGQVAIEVGIPNRSSFSRAFKEEFGHAPSEVTSTA